MHEPARFLGAVRMAARLHGKQTRKGNGSPYLYHLLGVAALVGEYGGDEDAVIAALLHDAAEDQGGQDTLLVIAGEFGWAVHDIVKACSDSLGPKGAVKAPWIDRKREYVQLADTKPLPAQLVSLADKTHNAESTAADLATHGAAVWDRFRGGYAGMVWYWDGLLAAYGRSGVCPPLLRRFAAAVARCKALTEASDPAALLAHRH